MTVSWENNQLHITGAHQQRIKSFEIVFGKAMGDNCLTDEMRQHDLIHPWALLLHKQICPHLEKYSIISPQVELLTWTLQPDSVGVELRFDTLKDNAIALYTRNLLKIVLSEYYNDFLKLAQNDSDDKFWEYLCSKSLIFEYDNPITIDSGEFWSLLNMRQHCLGTKAIIEYKQEPCKLYQDAKAYPYFHGLNVYKLLAEWRQ